jgi:hypothetical protein
MTKAQRIQYSEYEAADMLGISIDQLRGLVRDHIVKDAHSADPEAPVYQASDLVVLRFLAGIRSQPELARM